MLLFLTWDVLSAAWDPSTPSSLPSTTVAAASARPWATAFLFAVGLSVGLLSLVAYERWMSRRVTAGPRPAGPGAMTVGEPDHAAKTGWSPARRLALLIAVGIGLHNFAEGLAIGQSAASGELALAVLLVIGFGLHNATEGFGIVAPLAADVDEDGNRRIPSWGFLLALAAIGGGPTFIGTAVGHGFTSEPVSVAFLTLAAGSILYVVAQLLGVAARAKRPDLLGYGLLIGLSFASFPPSSAAPAPIWLTSRRRPVAPGGAPGVLRPFHFPLPSRPFPLA